MADKDLEKKETAVVEMYQNAVAIGTEEMTQADLNTPTLKVIQPNTQNIPGKTDGWFYRSDTQEQMNEVNVNLVYVTTQDLENFNKTGTEQVKVYFGFYAGTNEPFKMFVRGWGLGAHRQFQTQVARIKGKWQVPMLSLTVKLTSEKQEGIIRDTNKPYLVYKPVFTIQKTEDGTGPLVEMDPGRISFLVESAKRFKEMNAGISTTLSENDVEQNETMEDQGPKGETVEPSDIPF